MTFICNSIIDQNFLVGKSHAKCSNSERAGRSISDSNSSNVRRGNISRCSAAAQETSGRSKQLKQARERSLKDATEPSPASTSNLRTSKGTIKSIPLAKENNSLHLLHLMTMLFHVITKCWFQGVAQGVVLTPHLHTAT